MYLIEYELSVGRNRHYAPSASTAVRLVKDIGSSGGRTINITRTRDNWILTLEDLELLASQEVGPSDERPQTALSILRRLVDRKR